MTGWIVAIIVGGIAGWLASMVMARDGSMGIFWNIIVGIVGGVIGGVIAPSVGISSASWLGYLVVAFIGAIILLAIVNLVQRGRVR